MESLAYLVFGIGWPVLVIGSLWMWRNMEHLSHVARVYLNVSLASFYLLGFVCTVFWMGEPWYVAVFPAFTLFLVLFIVTLRTTYVMEHREHGDWGAQT